MRSVGARLRSTGPLRRSDVTGGLARLRRAAVRAALVFVALASLFALVGASRSGICLPSYRWDDDAGYLPVPDRCGPEVETALLDGAAFFVRASSGSLVGRGGRSREDASRGLLGLLVQRGGRSVAVLAVALIMVGLGSRVARGRLLPAGVPLPVAGFVLFAVVLRLVPPASAWDYDRAGILWAGLALALADGVARLLRDGVRARTAEEAGKPWAEHVALWGVPTTPLVDAVTLAERAAMARGAVLGLLGGLVVVEAAFGVNGLGETLKDLIVDRAGLDPLLLAGVLGSFGLAVLALDAVPDRVVARLVPT